MKEEKILYRPVCKSEDWSGAFHESSDAAWHEATCRYGGVVWALAQEKSAQAGEVVSMALTRQNDVYAASRSFIIIETYKVEMETRPEMRERLQKERGGA